MTNKHDLYRAACAADDDYHARLVEVYGRRAAGDKRYLFRHEDPELNRLAEVKRLADRRIRASTGRPDKYMAEDI